MLHVSNSDPARTVGAGKRGVTDRILYGADSRHIDPQVKQRTTPPSLQDLVVQSLLHHLVRIILVDRSELVGKITWYNDGRLCFRSHAGGTSLIMACNRIMTLSPIEVDEEALPFLTDSLRNDLLASEERTSRLQIVRRRLRERSNRIAAAAKYSNSS